MDAKQPTQAALDSADAATSDVMKQLADLDSGKLTGWAKTIAERAKLRLAKMKEAMLRQSQDYELVGYVEDPKKPGKALKSKNGSPVQIRRYVGWDRNSRYTGAKLRQIRREQTLKAVAGRTHFNDGTPIVQDRLVDLWK